MTVYLKRIDIFILIISLLIFSYNIHFFIVNGVLADLAIYERAAVAYLQNKNAYRPEVAQNLFVYNPVILHLFAYLERLFGFTHCIAAIYAFTTIWFGVEIYLCFHKLPIKNESIKKATILNFCLIQISALAFGGIGFLSFTTGNITLYTHFLLIACLLGFYRTDCMRYKIIFCILLLFFSIIKPYFLAYLAIIFLIFNNKSQIILALTFIIGAFGATWLSSMYFYAPEYQEFINALHQQILVFNDIGFSIFAVAINAHLSETVSIIIHIIFSIIMLYAFAFYLPRFFSIKTDLYARTFLLYFCLCIINPRMKEYDLYPAIICIFMFFHQITLKNKPIMLLGIIVSIIPELLAVISEDFVIKLPAIFTKAHPWQLLGLVIMFGVFAIYIMQDKNKDSLIKSCTRY